MGTLIDEKVQKINIFIISPSDVNDERTIAKEICQELNELTNHKINAVLWEYNPMPYYENPQTNINKALESSDIFIVILWNRMGTIIEGFEGAITKSKNVTGTQYEIEKILATKKESILFYIKKEEKKLSFNDAEELLKQKNLLNTFLKEINLVEGSTKYSYHTFKESNEFKEKLPIHLSIELEKRYDIDIKLPKKEKLTESLGINPVYYAGLYVFMIIMVMGTSLFIHDLKGVSKLVQEMTPIFLPLFVGIMILAIMHTYNNRSNSIKKSLKETTFLLLYRFVLIMGISLSLTVLITIMFKASVGI